MYCWFVFRELRPGVLHSMRIEVTGGSSLSVWCDGRQIVDRFDMPDGGQPPPPPPPRRAQVLIPQSPEDQQLPDSCVTRTHTCVHPACPHDLAMFSTACMAF